MAEGLIKDYRKPPESKKGHKGNTGPREPKKLQVKKRVMGKWKTHPVDKMVTIANFIQATNPELCAKIWMRLLDSCELEEKTKKGYMPPVMNDPSAAEAEAMRALEEAEKDDQATPQGYSDGVADRTSDLHAKTGTEEDLPGDPE